MQCTCNLCTSFNLSIFVCACVLWQFNDFSVEEGLGPADFKMATEMLDKSTKKLNRMGLLTG